MKRLLGSFLVRLDALKLLLRDPRTPRPARWLAAATLAYAVSPIDLIPDFIPVIGHLDDAIIVPLGLWLALRLVPAGLWEECLEKAEAHRQTEAPTAKQPQRPAPTGPADGPADAA